MKNSWDSLDQTKFYTSLKSGPIAPGISVAALLVYVVSSYTVCVLDNIDRYYHTDKKFKEYNILIIE